MCDSYLEYIILHYVVVVFKKKYLLTIRMLVFQKVKELKKCLKYAFYASVLITIGIYSPKNHYKY